VKRKGTYRERCWVLAVLIQDDVEEVAEAAAKGDVMIWSGIREAFVVMWDCWVK